MCQERNERSYSKKKLEHCRENCVQTGNLRYITQLQHAFSVFITHQAPMYRDRLKGMKILLSRTQAGSGRTGKQEQEQTSCNHVQAF